MIRNTIVFIIGLVIGILLLSVVIIDYWCYINNQTTISDLAENLMKAHNGEIIFWIVLGLIFGFTIGIITGTIFGHLFWPSTK